MQEPYGIEQMLGSMDKVITLGDDTVRESGPSNERMVLETAVARLKQLRTTAAEKMPQLLEKLQLVGNTVNQEAESLSGEFAGLHQKIAAVRTQAEAAKVAAAERRAAASKPPPIPPIPPVDAHLGLRLRDELLSRFAPCSDGEPPREGAGKDIWEDWK